MIKGLSLMFRQVRSDSRIDTIEARYGIDLNSRGDALLGNLLDERGFDSLSQLLKAYHGHATHLSRRRRLFLSFHAEDRPQVQGFRLMAKNPNLLDFDFIDDSVRSPIGSGNARYIQQRIVEKIQRASVVVCLIGNGTAWREWVDWELETGQAMNKGLCGVRLRGSRGRVPDLLNQLNSPIAQWDLSQIVAAIECAAARRS